MSSQSKYYIAWIGIVIGIAIGLSFLKGCREQEDSRIIDNKCLEYSGAVVHVEDSGLLEAKLERREAELSKWISLAQTANRFISNEFCSVKPLEKATWDRQACKAWNSYWEKSGE